jgi:predicted CoA-binding protein
MQDPLGNPDDGTVARLLEDSHRIAVVGLSPKPERPSNRVARYLLEHGYEVMPVYPREETILGRPVFRSVKEIPGGVDLVNVFRRSADLPAVVTDALAANAPVLWFQLDCIHLGAAERARSHGVLVVMDRCIMVEHARLLGVKR